MAVPIQGKPDEFKGETTVVDLAKSQHEIPPTKTYEQKPVSAAPWDERLVINLKKAGCVLGVAVCGAISIALFPVTITGQILLYLAKETGTPVYDSSRRELISVPVTMTSKILTAAAFICSLPVIGCVECINEYKKIDPPFEERISQVSSDIHAIRGCMASAKWHMENLDEMDNFSSLQIHQFNLHISSLKTRDLEKVRKIVVDYKIEDALRGLENEKDSEDPQVKKAKAVGEHIKDQMITLLDIRIEHRKEV